MRDERFDLHLAPTTFCGSGLDEVINKELLLFASFKFSFLFTPVFVPFSFNIRNL